MFLERLILLSSIRKGIKNFILVSTDKSVRPINFMGDQNDYLR